MLRKVHGASCIDGYDSQNKDKNITIAKNKSVTFPCKKHVIPYPGIDAILDVNNNMPVKFHKYNRKLSENSF